MYARSQIIGKPLKLEPEEKDHLKICPFCHFDYNSFLLYLEERGIEKFFEEFLRRAEQRGKELPFSLD
jgi:hypothetical protein